jgi:thymidylate kinase
MSARPRGDTGRPVIRSVDVAVLIAVWGASPGIGKSTLCAGLAERLSAAGLRVDHFQEEEILTRPQYAEVASHFVATGEVERDALLSATARFADSVLAAGTDVVIADALMPYVPSLLAMGHSEQAITGFMADLADVLASLRPVMIFLDGDASAALSRAAAREKPGWLEWYIGKLARYRVQPEVHDRASAAEYLRREREITLSVVRRQSWGLVLIAHAAELAPDEVLHVAQQGLNPWLADKRG